MTAEMFWDSLHDMARRGFVSEEIVSPQLTMNFAVGPVLVPVEMSSKNRKNRVYEYQPLIASDDMFSYLLAKNYLARAKNKISTNGKSRLTEKLLAKMLSNRRKTEQAYSENP